MKEYSIVEINGTKSVDMRVIDDTQYGEPQKKSYELPNVNFYMDIELWDNGSIEHIEWDMSIFRNPDFDNNAIPFNSTESGILAQGQNQRYDRNVTGSFFTYNLEYYEIHELDGELKKLRVNTEIASNNQPDGRVIKTAVHIIKRNMEGDIIFEYDWSIKEVDQFYKIFNYLDQPFLLVPYQLGLVAIVVYSYIRITNYIRENNVRIVKGQDGKETDETTSLEDNEDTQEKEEDK